MALWTGRGGFDLMGGIHGQEQCSMSSMTIGPIAGPAADPSERSALLFWMIFTGLSIFAVVLLGRFGLIRLMLTSDRTYISSVISLLFVLSCGHFFLRSRAISPDGPAAQRRPPRPAAPPDRPA